MLLTIKQAREELAKRGVQTTEWTLRHWINDLKELVAIKVGGRWYVESRDLDKLTGVK